MGAGYSIILYSIAALFAALFLIGCGLAAVIAVAIHRDYRRVQDHFPVFHEDAGQ